MATKEAKPEFDFSKLTPAEMIELAKKLEADAAAGIQTEFENDINYIVKRAKSLGKTLTNYAAAIIAMMDAVEKGAMYANLKRSEGGVSTATVSARKKRAPNGSAKAAGPMPERGATYKNPATGETWTKAASGKGRTITWLQELVDKGGKFEDYKVQ